MITEILITAFVLGIIDGVVQSFFRLFSFSWLFMAAKQNENMETKQVSEQLRKAVKRVKNEKSSFVPFTKTEFINGVSKARSSCW